MCKSSVFTPEEPPPFPCQPIPSFSFVSHAAFHDLVCMKQPLLFAYLNLKHSKTSLFHTEHRT